jgi:superfamily I DNA/RNA helicase
MNDFGITQPIYLRENRRCPRHIFDLARRLIEHNPRNFEGRETPLADRTSPFAVAILGFEADDAELAWVVSDIVRDRAEHGHRLGDIAVLYRKHEIGDALEAALINSGIACRLAHGRALSEEQIVAYVLAALRVITYPHDDVVREGFFAAILPSPLMHDARARARSTKRDITRALYDMSRRLPRGDSNAKRIRLLHETPQRGMI